MNESAFIRKGPVRRCDLRSGELNIRSLRRSDMPEVLRCENASYSMPWGSEEFEYYTADPHCIWNVLEDRVGLVGFSGSRVADRDTLLLLNVAVLPESRRLGYASLMIDLLKEDIRTTRPLRYLRAATRKGNRRARLFFSSCGFVRTSRDDGVWRFEWSVDSVGISR